MLRWARNYAQMGAQLRSVTRICAHLLVVGYAVTLTWPCSSVRSYIQMGAQLRPVTLRYAQLGAQLLPDVRDVGRAGSLR